MSSVIVMQLRYAFRLYPDTRQQTALAKAFGCARVMFNDAVRARAAQAAFPKIGGLSTPRGACRLGSCATTSMVSRCAVSSHA
jgi:hypothetical protein